MTEKNYLPKNEAEVFGQILHLTFQDLKGKTIQISRADVDWALQVAASGKGKDVKLSAPKPAPQQASAPKVLQARVQRESETNRRAREIRDAETVAAFERKYGKGATIADAREQDALDDYLRGIGL